MKHVYDFIDKVRPIAKQVEYIYGIPQAISIAQSALETGWGRHVKGNAYFGVKGAGQDFMTHEYVDGVRVSVRDSFREYKSMEDSWMDYGKLLGKHPRYALIHERDTIEGKVREIHAAGYATDPEYANKVLSIIHRWNLDKGSFKDIPVDHWAEEAIEWSCRNGILEGYPDGEFKPDRSISRAEVILVLYRFSKYVEGIHKGG